MNENILDDTLVDDLRWSLEPDERIVWEGAPNMKTIFSNPFKNTNNVFEDIVILIGVIISGVLLLIFIIMIILFFAFMSSTLRYIIGLLVLIDLATRAYRYIKRKKTKYTITNKRIIFQLWEIKNKVVHYEIPFSEIKNVATTVEYKNTGVIYLGVKNPGLILFETKNLNNGDKRHQPTIEFIDNVKKVAKIIRKGMQEKL